MSRLAKRVLLEEAIMYDEFKIKLMNAFRSIQHACATAVIRDDDGDDGDIATPKTTPADDL
jgi:hypothetical protein